MGVFPAWLAARFIPILFRRHLLCFLPSSSSNGTRSTHLFSAKSLVAGVQPCISATGDHLSVTSKHVSVLSGSSKVCDTSNTSSRSFAQRIPAFLPPQETFSSRQKQSSR